MSVLVYCDNKWHSLANQQVYSNSEWEKLSAVDKLNFNENWYALGATSDSVKPISVISNLIPEPKFKKLTESFSNAASYAKMWYVSPNRKR